MKKLNDVQLCIIAQTCLKEAVTISIEDKSIHDTESLKRIQKDLFDNTIKLVEDKINDK